MNHDPLLPAELDKTPVLTPETPAQPSADKSEAPPGPSERDTKRGRLSNEVELSLHTKSARLLCLGYDDPDKVGLLRFAQLTSMLWSAVKNDDPYAEWRLMQLYDQMTDLREDMKRLENRCQQRLSQLRGLVVNLYSNPNPFKILLRFASPFSFMATWLLADLDYVERQFYTLRRLGLVLEGYSLATGFIPQVRAILRQPLQWQNTGVTRKDLRENNAKAQQVRAIAGEVPLPVLNKQVQFSFLPKK